ncbi:response regulator [Clostridium sp. 19966]|uniref:response regulator n=1 Tax=Clostridium sp. 19966 TaxID=2768166 RepID=UPI0028EA17A5|nr:response regulator [Clostridium sp. 19966]
MNKSILVIEDEEDIRDILTHYIKKEGYVVKEAMDGETGIRLVERESIDLIILDLMLPDMSGFDVCKKISSNHKIPILCSLPSVIS